MFSKLRAMFSGASEFRDQPSFENTLLKAGLSGSAAARLSALGRPSLCLAPAETGARPFTKIGGLPDLPGGMDWPVRPPLPKPRRQIEIDAHRQMPQDRRAYCDTAQPLSFIAQIGFAEMSAAALPDLGLPRSGALWLFYDTVEGGWGYQPEDAVTFAVLHAPDISDTAPATPPDFHPDAPLFPEVRLTPHAAFDPAPDDVDPVMRLDLAEGDADAYRHVFLDHLDRSPFPNHKLGGWADAIQGPMETECALVSAGYYCGDSDAYFDPETETIRNGPNDWRPLLQIDSDDNADMMWGDVGRLYLWCRASDLARGDLSKTWLILQCS